MWEKIGKIQGAALVYKWWWRKSEGSGVTLIFSKYVRKMSVMLQREKRDVAAKYTRKFDRKMCVYLSIYIPNSSYTLLLFVSPKTVLNASGMCVSDTLHGHWTLSSGTICTLLSPMPLQLWRSTVLESKDFST